MNNQIMWHQLKMRPEDKHFWADKKLKQQFCCRGDACDGTRPVLYTCFTYKMVLEGQDILAPAQPGTGTPAAFSLPILQLLGERKGRGRIRNLVLTPTRELALQIDESFRTYGR